MIVAEAHGVEAGYLVYSQQRVKVGTPLFKANCVTEVQVPRFKVGTDMSLQYRQRTAQSLLGLIDELAVGAITQSALSALIPEEACLVVTHVVAAFATVDITAPTVI